MTAPRDFQKLFNNVFARLFALEMRFNPQGIGDAPPWHFPGVLLPGSFPVQHVSTDRTLLAVLAWTGSVAGTTNTVFNIHKNGVIIDSNLTYPSATTVSLYDLTDTEFVTQVDALGVTIVTAGTGLTDFVVQPIWG